MKTDINRLHAVIENRLTGRGCGKTFALCHTIAGEVELGKCKEIMFLIREENQIKWIMPMLLEVLSEHLLTINRCDLTTINVENKIIRFVSENKKRKWFNYSSDTADFYLDSLYEKVEETCVNVEWNLELNLNKNG